MKLQPLTIQTAKGDDVTLVCTHREEWPPAHARLQETAVSLRASGAITEAKYQQLQTWGKICGLMAMSVDKCPTCPLALCESKTGHLVPFSAPGTPPTALPPFVRAKPGKDRA